MIELKRSKFCGLNVLKVVCPVDEKNLELEKNKNKIILHHPGNRKNYSIDLIREIQVDKFNFAAIGYHFIIDYRGNIYYSRPLKYKGAHSRPNTGKIGIGFSFSMNKIKISPEAFDSLKKLLKVLCKKYNIGPENIVGHVQDQIAEINNIMGFKYIDENEVLNFKSRKEFMKFRKNLIENSPKKISHIVNIFKSCPGILFYDFLRKKDFI